MFGKTFKDYLYGTIPNTNLTWEQAIKIKIEYRFNQYWLLIEPKIWVEAPDNLSDKQINLIKNFINKKYTYRYNFPSNIILNNWIAFLVGKNKDKIISLDDKLENSPKFKVNGTTAFTGRLSDE